MGTALTSRSRGTKRRASRGPRLDETELRAFGARLRAWYRRNARDLPWRRTRDPYHILVSELMLQQTQVSRVLDFWRRFLDRFPTLHHLADAREAQVLEAWAGLGYYARARNLHKAAVELDSAWLAAGATGINRRIVGGIFTRAKR